MSTPSNRDDVERIGRRGLRVRDTPLGPECRMLDRYWLVADPEDLGFTPHARNDGFWEAWITAWIMREMDRGVAFADVGANMGYYGLLACSMGCPTQFFEPQPKLAELLQASIAANHYGELARLSVVAVGAAASTAVFTVPKGHGMNGTFAGAGTTPGLTEADYTRYPVTVRPLDMLLAHWEVDRPLLIKVDAEGAETHIWAGMQEIWRTRKPTVLLEYRADRYVDPIGFAEQLMSGGKTTYVDTTGEEVPLTSHEILTDHPHQDWMVVVRHSTTT
jgi:FkbM family methyltransferase